MKYLSDVWATEKKTIIYNIYITGIFSIKCFFVTYKISNREVILKLCVLLAMRIINLRFERSVIITNGSS